ncbi:MAG: hypothetical protein ABIQ95_13575 [Bdellovibrionia bacterium]
MVLKTPKYHLNPSSFRGSKAYDVKVWSTLGFLAFAALHLGTSNEVRANLPTDEVKPAGLQQSTQLSVRSKLRIRNFIEFMTPALQGQSSSIPNSDGSGYIPTTVFNIFSADYEIAPNYRILYTQRVFLFLTEDPDFQSMSIFGRDPRFGLRRTQVFDLPNLNTTYDLYFQPGISNNQISGGNRFEVGFRTSTNYVLPGTRWTLGIVQELTTGYLDVYGTGLRAYGWFVPWFSYDLSDKISLQHFTNLAFKNPRNLTWTQFKWDDQPPFMQNGVNFNLTKSVSASLFLNNYLGVAPTLRNTWASLWLSIDLI